MSGDAAAISCAGVVKRFGDVTALDELDLSVDRGSIVGYLGPNGAGKTTTIRILLDLARPDRGQVRVLGAAPRGRRSCVVASATCRVSCVWMNG